MASPSWFLNFLRSQLFVTPTYPTASFEGKTVIVTGSNTGLGKEAARHIARLGASTLILAVRNTDLGARAKADIESTTKCSPSTIQVWPLDLSSYESIKSFADRANTLPRLDAVIANAGINTANFKKIEGDESTITVNVVSTFLLGVLVLPKLKETAKQFNTRPALAIVTSELHFVAAFKEARKLTGKGQIFKTLSDEKTADMGDRYNVSKLLEVMVVNRWAEIRSANQFPITIDCVNPGFCHSELMRDMSLPMKIIGTTMKAVLARTTEVGGRTLVHAAGTGSQKDKELHGQYLSNCGVADKSSFVTSERGQALGIELWEELSQKLEAVAPGCTANL